MFFINRAIKAKQDVVVEDEMQKRCQEILLNPPGLKINKENKTCIYIYAYNKKYTIPEKLNIKSMKAALISILSFFLSLLQTIIKL